MIRYLAIISLAFWVFSSCRNEPVSLPPTIVEFASPAIGQDNNLIEAVGVEGPGGVFNAVLEKGTEVPCTGSEVLSISLDNQQRELHLSVFRGNASMVRDCQFLGKFKISNNPPFPRGKAQIEITLSVRDGYILILAKDLNTKSQMFVVPDRD